MPQTSVVRRAGMRDIQGIQELLLEWLGIPPSNNREAAIADAVGAGEILVAVVPNSKVVGLIHYVVHNDLVDGAPNAFITAFFVTESYRSRGIGSALLDQMILDARGRCVVEIETSVNHDMARRFYERHGFKQSVGDMGEIFLELDSRGQEPR